MTTQTATELQRIIDAALHGKLNRSMAERLHAFGPEAVVLAMLAANKRIAEQTATIARLRNGSAKPSPSTPSGMVPIYTKPSAPKRHKKPGARPGHPGSPPEAEPAPTRIDKRESHRLKCSPCCGPP